MKFLCLLLGWYPLLVCGQDTGIHFEKNQSWSQVKAKAKEEHKGVFLECYATWCGPCKEMERKVFPIPALDRAVAVHFIAVRVQMDSTSHDDASIKDWYATAREIGTTYRITELPSFLFFSVNGELLDKEIGYKDSIDFAAMIRDAQDPDKQYYSLQRRFREGYLPPARLAYLADKAKILGDRPLADTVAQYCLENYFPTLPEKELLRYDHLYFLSWFIDRLHTTDSLFRFLIAHEERIDRVMSKGFAQNLSDGVIAMDEIYPLVYQHNRPVAVEPQWTSIQSGIARKFGDSTASRIVLNTQIDWYYRKKDWPRVIEYFIEKNERYGPDTLGRAKYLLNNQIFTIIFKHSKNKQQLWKAVQWMKLVVDGDPRDAADVDTYANLLYKYGNTGEAIEWEEKACVLAPGEAEIHANLDKMKKGIATWPD